MLVLSCTYIFPLVYIEIENWDFECCSRLDFPIFPNWWKRYKVGIFWISPCLLRDSLVDQFMLLTHLYFMQGEKIEAWFVSPSNKEYFGVESTTFCLSTNSQKIYPLVRWTANYVFFFTGEAMKIAVSFSKFQCLCAMLLLWDNTKHGFQLLKNFNVARNQFSVKSSW